MTRLAQAEALRRCRAGLHNASDIVLMRLPLFLCLFAFVTSRFGTASADPAESDRAVLLADVSEIAASGAPGPLCVFGPDAFPLVAGREGKNTFHPVAAAARWEKGRVVAFGHDGFLDAHKEPGGSGRALLNAVRWVSDSPDHNERGRIGVHRNRGLADFLKASGWDVESLEGADAVARLDTFRVLVTNSHHLTRENDLTAVARFVKAGGGLVTAGLGWGWQQLNPGKELVTDHPGNRLLGPAGIVWANGTIERTAERGYLVDAGADLSLLNASTALDALLSHSGQKATLAPAQLAQAAATLTSAVRSIPPGDSLLLPRFSSLAGLPDAGDFPRPDKPLKSDNPLARLLFTQTLQLLGRTQSEQVRPHPAAEFFPGSVPAAAPRVKERTLTIATAVPGWHSTGLYAAPGELIRISVPPRAAGTGLAIRIGCHSDALWHHDAWRRAPEISRVEQITGSTTAMANPFGGLVYLVVPDGCTLGSVTMDIAGAVEAPRFALGRTTLSEWQEHLRKAPAPWAELETSKVILTVPSDNVRTLENPEALLKFWDQVLDAQADLATIPRDRNRPERIVADVQISAGYMHSGYPIMTHLDVTDRTVSVEKLKSGGWGFWHELGHNHQRAEWTFSGTGEVTCNLFSLYVCETLCGHPPGLGHDAMEPAKAAQRLRKHLATGASFERWKSDPFLALTMYDHLRQGFGWETYKKVFAEYRSLQRSEQPKTDAEKRDAWLVRFSRAAGRNLGPFFQAWGVPTSEPARTSLSDLPPWMPADWPHQ